MVQLHKVVSVCCLRGGKIMKVIIDRIEEDRAIVELENGEMQDLSTKLLPAMAAEGDVLCIEIDEDETERRKNRLNELLNGLEEE